MRRNVVVCAAMCIVAIGVALAGDAAAERNMLEGSWKVVSGQQGGKKLGEKWLRPHEFKGDKLTLGTTGLEYDFTLDPAKDPKEIDVKGGFNLQGEFVPKAKGGMKGIYKLKGDKLTMSFALPGKPRPTTLESVAGDESMVFVLNREKK